MDLEFISTYTPMYIEAAGLTIRIAVYGSSVDADNLVVEGGKME